MLDVNIDTLNESIESTKLTLREGVLSINIWDKENGLTLTDWQGNPTAVALLNQMTFDLIDAIHNAEFPNMKDYYYLDLKENKSLVVIDHGDQLMEGWLLDSTKTNPGILLSMAIPKALINAKASKVSNADQDAANALELIMASNKMGLWDMMVDAGDPISPNNEFTWSAEFRDMLGFQGTHDFPNVLESWSSRLHPEHKEIVLNAFANHLNDYTGETKYDIEYQLMMKSGEYRWFKATGETSRNLSGMPLRVVGALKDIQKDRDKSGHSLLINHVV